MVVVVGGKRSMHDQRCGSFVAYDFITLFKDTLVVVFCAFRRKGVSQL